MNAKIVVILAILEPLNISKYEYFCPAERRSDSSCAIFCEEKQISSKIIIYQLKLGKIVCNEWNVKPVSCFEIQFLAAVPCYIKVCLYVWFYCLDAINSDGIIMWSWLTYLDDIDSADLYKLDRFSGWTVDRFIVP